MKNLVLRQSGQRPVVLVKCDSCGELVARYELSGYYHHGKGFEAWLRTLPLATESTVDLQDTFLSLQERAPEELRQAEETLDKAGKDV